MLEKLGVGYRESCSTGRTYEVPVTGIGRCAITSVLTYRSTQRHGACLAPIPQDVR